MCQTKIKPKPRVESLGECGLDPVQEGHCVCDAVKGKSPCPVIHVHAYPGASHEGESRLLIIMPQRGAGAVESQAPGLVVGPKPALLAPSVPADAPVCQRNVSPVALPLSLPVAACRYALCAQHLKPTVKALRMIGI